MRVGKIVAFVVVQREAELAFIGAEVIFHKIRILDSGDGGREVGR